MKFPLVSRKRMESANLRIGLLEVSLAKSGADLEKISGHNATLKVTLGTVRNELIKANAEIKGQQAEIDRLTAAFEKLTADYNDLGKKVPAFRPKAVKWHGPDGARAQIERALIQQKQERTAVVATNSATRGE